MPTKPFSLQSPEQIAKDYGGNKQKIAHAAQMGLVDSTAAVLAGMFIDRMRSAQGQEQQPQQTVAQQVLSPQPPAPPPGPPQGGPPMGMAGAPPVGGMQQRLGMATQQGGVPVPPPKPAGPGFAEGGLAGLPVPSGMFDEPANGGFNDGGLMPSYGDGGIVAFAAGDEVIAPPSLEYNEDTPWFSRPIQAPGGAVDLAGGKISSLLHAWDAQQAERRAATRAELARRQPERKTDPAAPPPSAEAYRKALKLPTPAPTPTARPAAAAPPRALVAPPARSMAAPTPIAAPRPPSPVAPVAPVAPGAVPSPGAIPVPSPAQPPPLSGAAAAMAELQALAPQDHAMRDTMGKRYADMSSPEAIAAQKKQDLWATLAQIGFGMAGSNSPYFLQAAGQAGAAALPGMQQAAQARKAQEMAGLQGQLGIENLTNQERQSLAARATELSEQRRKGEIDQQQFEEQMELKREELAVDREYKRAMAGAAGARASRVGSGGSGGAAKPMTVAQATGMLRDTRDYKRASPSERLRMVQDLRSQYASGTPATAPSTAADYTFVNGKLVPARR